MWHIDVCLILKLSVGLVLKFTQLLIYLRQSEINYLFLTYVGSQPLNVQIRNYEVY